MMGTAGQDFDEYRQWLESAGVDVSLVRQVPGKFTASFFCSTDRDGNQIASFYTGAMAHASELSFASAGPCDLTIISPNDPAAMVAYARECRQLGIPYIYDPSQQVARMGGDDIKEGVVGAHIVICNDYEFAIIGEKTGLGASDMLAHVTAVVVTKGEKGASIMLRDRTIDVPAVPPSVDRRSDGRRRRVSRRVHEGAGDGGRLRGVRSAGERGGHVRPRAHGRVEPLLHPRRVPRPLRAALPAGGAI